MISLILAMAAMNAAPTDRTYEGDWYVSDDTNNNTGERKVYAFSSNLGEEHKNTVFMQLKCIDSVPIVELEWWDLKLPKRTVVTFGVGYRTEPTDHSFIFEKSPVSYEKELRASQEDSEKIIKTVGDTEFLILTVETVSGEKWARIPASGIRGAWERVVRHCPVRKYPLPPI